MPNSPMPNTALARNALPTLRRTLEQYANCTPAAVSGGSQAQMYYFVEDAKRDIAILAAALAVERERCARLCENTKPVTDEPLWHGQNLAVAIRAGDA